MEGCVVLTSEGCLGAGHQEEALALGPRLLAHVVAQGVAAAFPAVQAQALAEAIHAATLVTRALCILVQQGVDEKVHSPLMGTLYGPGDGCDTGRRTASLTPAASAQRITWFLSPERSAVICGVSGFLRVVLDGKLQTVLPQAS